MRLAFWHWNLCVLYLHHLPSSKQVDDLLLLKQEGIINETEKELI